MMRLSWRELSQILSDKLQQNDYQNITPLLENAQALNESYATKPLYFDRIDSCVKELYELGVNRSASTEQISKKMQELCDCMQDVVKSQIKPLMLDQFWFMDRMTALGYKITGRGECYGMSHMAIQAFLAKDMKTFNQRLQTIYYMPVDEFKNDFPELRKTGDAAAVNKIIVDILAFFDGIALNQRPDIYLHDNDNQPISKKQDVRKTMPITMPVTLETDANKPSIIATFTGAYSKENLTDYLDLLKNQLGANSFALHLVGLMHAITVAYDADTGRWLLVDPQHLPGEEYINTKHLTDALFAGFPVLLSALKNAGYLSEIRLLVMGTQITTTTQYAQQMQSQFENLKENTEWSHLHDANNKNTADILGITPSNLYECLYENPEDIKWDDKQILDKALETGLTDVIMQLINTKGKETFQNIEVKKLKSMLLAIPLDHQQKLLEKLSIKQKADIINGDYQGNDSVLFQVLPEKDRLPVFLMLDTRAQNNCLTGLVKEALTEQCNLLLENLTIKQKADVIGNGSNPGNLLQILRDEERLPVFLKFSPYSQHTYLQDLSKAGLIEQRNNLLQHLTIDQKADVIANAENPSDVLQMLTVEERIPVFLKLPSKTQADCLTKLTDTEYRNSLSEQLSVEQKANIILDRFDIPTYITFTEQRRLEIGVLLQMLHDDKYLTVFLKLQPRAQAVCMAILSSAPLIAQRDKLLQKLSVEQKITILEHYNDMSAEDAECLTAIMNSLPEPSRFETVMKQDREGRTILHRAANNSACLTVLLGSLTVPQRLEAVKIKDNNGQIVLLFATNPDCLNMILNVYPEDERPEALTATSQYVGAYSSILYYAFCSDDLLTAVMKNLPHGQRPEDNPEKLRSVHRVLSVLFDLPPSKPDCVSAIVRMLPEKQLIEAIREKASHKPALLNRAIDENPAFLSAFLNGLSDSTRFKMLDEQDTNGYTLLVHAISNPLCVSLIMKAYPEHGRLNALMIKDNAGNNVLYFASDKPDCMKAILNELNVNERFEVLKSLQNDEFGFQLPGLFPEMKKIMLDKIQSTDSESGFEEVKQRIIDATTFPELKVQLQELDYLYLKAKQSVIKSNVNARRSDVENVYNENQASIIPKKK